MKQKKFTNLKSMKKTNFVNVFLIEVSRSYVFNDLMKIILKKTYKKFAKISTVSRIKFNNQ